MIERVVDSLKRKSDTLWNVTITNLILKILNIVMPVKLCS